MVAKEAFSSANSRWAFGSYPDEYLGRVDFGFVSGAYHWELAFRTDRVRWVASPYGSVVDFYASVDAAALKLSRGSDIAVGLMFGREGDRDYTFMLNSNRYFGISRTIGNENNIAVDWAPIQIDLSRQTRMAVLVNEGRMTFFVNGNLVGEYRQPEFTGGAVGMSVGGPAGATTLVAFDNFELRRKPSN